MKQAHYGLNSDYPLGHCSLQENGEV